MRPPPCRSLRRPEVPAACLAQDGCVPACPLACAVLGTLCEVAACGGGGEVEFDVVLGQEELSERALQLCHLLPAAGYFPVSDAARAPLQGRELMGPSGASGRIWRR